MHFIGKCVNVWRLSRDRGATSDSDSMRSLVAPVVLVDSVSARRPVAGISYKRKVSISKLTVSSESGPARRRRAGGPGRDLEGARESRMNGF